MSTRIIFKSGVDITVPHTVTNIERALNGQIISLGWAPVVKNGQQIMSIDLLSIDLIIISGAPGVKNVQ